MVSFWGVSGLCLPDDTELPGELPGTLALFEFETCRVVEAALYENFLVDWGGAVLFDPDGDCFRKVVVAYVVQIGTVTIHNPNLWMPITA